MPMKQVVVTTVLTPVYAQNARRSTSTIRNISAQQVLISEDQSDVVNQGFPIDNGQAPSFTYRDGDQPENAMWAIVAAGTATLKVYEGYGPRV
jgi:hypothetical protein